MKEARYVTATTARTKRPKDTKRWYQCTCGLWWGKNKHFRCSCGELPPSFGKRRDRAVRFGRVG